MIAVVSERPKAKPFAHELMRIRSLAESCARQLTAWTESIEGGPVHGKRHRTPASKERQQLADKAAAFRRNFLRNLKPEHPLYNSSEAKAARGEREDSQ